MKLEYCNKPVVCVCLIIAIFIVFYSIYMGSLNAGLNFGIHIGNLKYNTSLETYDESKPSFVMFHVGWCGHCKTTLPIFEDLKAQYAGTSNILAVDVTDKDDEIKKYKLSGFPTIRYYNSDYTNPNATFDEYNGPRTLDSFLSFIKQHESS